MLTNPQHEAALEVARDRISNRAIAQKAGIAVRTLDTWKDLPEFKAEVERLLNEWATDIEKTGIADKRRRIFRLNDRWRRGQSFIEQRRKLFKQMSAEDPLLASVPGGDTGMVGWKLKTIHTGEQCYEKVIEYEWDTGLAAAMNAIEEQAGIELGQWKPKNEISFATDGGPLRVQNLSSLTDDELRLLIGLARKLAAAGPGGGVEPPQPEPVDPAIPGPGAAPQRTLPQAP
jgi:hypothetical protein